MLGLSIWGKCSLAQLRAACMAEKLLSVPEMESALARAGSEALLLDVRACQSLLQRIEIIAHRLRAVRQADRALVFDSGTIVEDGRHEDLIDSDGLYSRLYRHAEV